MTKFTKLMAAAALLAIPLSTNDVHADLPVMRPTTQQIMLSTWVNVECTILTGNEFSTLHVKNTTNATIPKGTTYRYTITNNGTTSNQTGTSSSDTPPTQVAGFSIQHMSQNATCKATFNAGDPDIKVTGVRWTDATTATVDLVNENRWIGTSPFAVRLASFNCVSIPVKSVDSPTLMLARNEAKTITLNLQKSGATYLTATADFDNKVREADEGNNVGTSTEFKTCSAR